ncbi:MAG: GIY-YIG nuclease family protein [Candidatus Paceibacterota bacterium]|jgi:putative endonuclease
MYYTYVLKSLINNNIYVGSTEDIKNRLFKHNSGKVKSTKAYKPWVLLETREFITRSEAYIHEMFLKSGQQKELLREKYIKAR